MHISEVEKSRMEKDHQMRYGYADHRNSRFPHQNEVNESNYIFKDMENKHAKEEIPQNNYGPGAP
jgi:hypothetical protein